MSAPRIPGLVTRRDVATLVGERSPDRSQLGYAGTGVLTLLNQLTVTVDCLTREVSSLRADMQALRTPRVRFGGLSFIDKIEISNWNAEFNEELNALLTPWWESENPPERGEIYALAASVISADRPGEYSASEIRSAIRALTSILMETLRYHRATLRRKRAMAADDVSSEDRQRTD